MRPPPTFAVKNNVSHYFDSPVAVVTLSCEPVAMRNRICAAPAAIIQFCVIHSRPILLVNVLAFLPRDSFFSANV